jgi:hypothetical protein
MGCAHRNRCCPTVDSPVAVWVVRVVCVKPDSLGVTPARQSRKLGNFELRILNFELLKSQYFKMV